MEVGVSSNLCFKSGGVYSKPNILLLMTDQHRADCLGSAGHPVVQTPNIDWLASTGLRFNRAYSTCPVCIPARRSLMTGKSPSSHGVLMNYNTVLDGKTMPGVLSSSGYQSHLVGKLHLWPERKLYGFMSADWSDGPASGGDYGRFLNSHGLSLHDAGVGHGINQNGWIARPWHLDERLHFTSWCGQKAVEFLERRDPTVPFFLKVSFHQPHEPMVPPVCYWDRYINQDLPEPIVGEWAKKYSEPQKGLPPAAWRICLDSAAMKQARAGYYGCINHIDDQIGRILDVIPENTIVLFLSDHGDMLGDHQWIRKRNAYEGSSRIPLIIRMPAGSDCLRGKVLDQLVCLEDVMPTVLEMAGLEIPDGVDGHSMMPLVRGSTENLDWRKHIHGECSDIPTMNSGMQFVTDGKSKYIWYPGQGMEQFFDLEEDPDEETDLSNASSQAEKIERFRDILTDELKGRPEGFVSEGQLQVLDGSTPRYLPGYERP